MKKLAILTIGLIIIYLVGIFNMFWAHEMSHVAIYRNYGIPSEIKISFGIPLIVFRTVPNYNDVDLSPERVEDLKFLQSNVEVGYQYIAIAMLLSSLMVMMTLVGAKIYLKADN